MSRTAQDATIAQLDQDIAKVDAVLTSLLAQWPGDGPVPEQVGQAWNLLHDARAALVEDRHQASLPEIPSHERGTYALVCQNVD